MGWTRPHLSMLCLLAVVASPLLAAQEPVPVHREPRHRPVLEDGPVRVLDVRLPPGDTSLFHVHDEAILYVPVALSPIAAQPLGGAWAGAGPVSRFRLDAVATDTHYAARPLTHRVANVGAGLFHLIAVTNGGPGGRSEGDTSLPGMVETTSTWFRQTRLALASGAGTGWQTSAVPVVVVQTGEGRADLERHSGTTTLDGAGAWGYVRAGERFRLWSRARASTLVLVQVR